MLTSLDFTFPLDSGSVRAPDAELGNARLWLIGSLGETGSLHELAGDSTDDNASQAALLLAGFEKAGSRALRDLTGIFAGIWQQGTTVHLFRDALGCEPLHYRQHDGRLFVHSDMLPLGRLGARPRVDANWLAGFLLLIPEARDATAYRDVHRVPPGSIVTIEPGREPRVELYWAPDLQQLDLSLEEAVATAERLVDKRLQAHGKAPLLLSAGVDSNVMLSRLAQAGNLGDAITGSPSVHAEAAGGDTIDEYPLAHAAYHAVGGGGDHYRLRAAPSGLREAIDWGFEAFERPMYNPSNLGWMDGCQALAATLGDGTVFDGTLGNFTIGHNGEHPVVALAAQRRWRDMLAECARHGGHGLRAVWREAPPEWLLRLKTPSAGRRQAKRMYLKTSNRFVASERRRAVAAGYQADQPADGMPFPQRRLRDVILQLDLANSKRAARRRHGVELVDPYGHPELVAFSLRLPEELYRQPKRVRRVQRAMLDPRLPEIIRLGRAGGMQGADWRAAAIRDAALMRQIVDRLRDGHPGAEIFDVEAMDRTLRQWPASGWNDEEQVMTYRVRLMRTLTGAAFAQWVAEQ
ncbi:asparagine synthase-related protein [Sphingomicrobium sp. XHP0239]|uniref:asparagine synthase-related protein n=1 Tax=Sphingomicrobium maritimum TaxID=3133972 RepID=UPI0031CCB15D